MSAHLPDELLAAHLDGVLSPIEREAADAHLDVCARCRGELELAEGARAALRALPAELRPPTDIAAAVTEEVAGRGGGGTARVRSVDGPAGGPVIAGPPRWYRAATVAAVAAAIGLAAVIVPTLGGSESDRGAPAADACGAVSGAAEATRTADAGAQNDGGDQQDTTAAASGAFERSERDYDVRSLLGLVEESGPLQAVVGESALSDLQTDRVACARDAGGDVIPREARAVRLIAATYEGTPADIAVFAVGPDESRQILVVAAASRDCRLLAVAP